MLKRVSALLLVLVCLICSACAEGFMPYTSVTGLYSFDIPSDYLAVNTEDMNKLLQYIDINALFSLLGLEAGGTTEDMVAALKESGFDNMDYFFSSDFTANMNAVPTPDAGITPAALELFYSALDEQLFSLYGSMGIPESGMQSLGMVSKGENRFYGFVVNLSVLTLSQYIICNDDGLMITFTFTNMAEADIDTILTSFSF